METIYSCPRDFNEGIRKYSNKLHYEFSLIEKMFEKYKNMYDDDLLFICGKLGGVNRYGRFFSYLRKYKIRESAEGKDSGYILSDFGEIRFLKDADSLHMPVALSSVFGKYVREFFMAGVNNYFRKEFPSLRPVSGYNDCVTKEFIRKTEDTRRRAGVPDDCFLRIK